MKRYLVGSAGRFRSTILTRRAAFRALRAPAGDGCAAPVQYRHRALLREGRQKRPYGVIRIVSPRARHQYIQRLRSPAGYDVAGVRAAFFENEKDGTGVMVWNRAKAG